MPGGSKQTEEKKEVATNKTDPVLMGMLTDNYDGAKGRAAGLTPYSGPLTAGFTPTQTQSHGILSALATDPRFRTANQNAAGIVQGVADSNPGDLTEYMNPFTDSVVSTTLADLSHARDQQGVADRQSSTNAGSFQGAGTRQAVKESLTTDDYLRNVGSTSAGLRAANFTQAQNAKLAYGDQRMRAGGILADLNNNDFSLATQQGGILAGVGADQQAQIQREYDNARAAYESGLALTERQQQLLNQALGLIPNHQTVTSNGTNTTTKSGDVLGGILGAVAGGAKIGSQFYGSK